MLEFLFPSPPPMATNKNSQNHPNPHHQVEFPPQDLHHHHHHLLLPLEDHLAPPPHHQQHRHQVPRGLMMQQPSPSAIAGGNFPRDNDTGGAYDLGELDQALFLYLDGQDPSTSLHQDQKQIHPGMSPPTLNIFPSQPMHVDHPSTSKVGGGGLVSPGASGSNRPSAATMELANQRNINNDPNINNNVPSAPPAPAKPTKRGGNRRGLNTNYEQDGPKTPDPKTLRRLAQNREAARKSRLRKKAYIQQLESSRIKLAQLEQELQRARSQGIFVGGGPVAVNEQGIPVGISNISTDAAIFDLEYARWQEEHHRLMCELRAAVQEHFSENELQLFVDNALAHYDEILNLRSMIAKSDVFHLVSGMWMTPAERCFMWIGGFRPSSLIKVIMNYIEPLTEQQILAVCGVQQSTQEAEEALSQGLESLNQSLADTISFDLLSYPTNMANYMGQMATAMSKLSTLEGFVRQADNLRHQTIRRLNQILTTRQSARFLLAAAEHSHRLRALSSLWITRPRQE